MREAVWVHKILNPRSAVVTYNEAFEIIKEARVFNSRLRNKAESFTLEKLEPPTIKEQKNDIIKLNKLLVKKDDLKEVLELKNELKEIEESKVKFEKAIESKTLLPNGLGRVVYSKTRNKERKKNEKKTVIKTDSVWKKLTQLPTSAFNHEALDKLQEDSEDEKVPCESRCSNEDDEIIVPKKKKKLIVESDDEDETDPVVIKQEIVSPPITMPKLIVCDDEPIYTEISEIDMSVADSITSFKKAMNESHIRCKGDSKVITCEDGVIYAMSKLDWENLNNYPVVTNIMFTDRVLKEYYREDDDADEMSLEKKWIKKFVPNNNSKNIGNSYVEYEKNKICEMLKFGNYNEKNEFEFLKDKTFKDMLLDYKSCINVSEYLGLNPIQEDVNKESILPTRELLNSLFTVEEADILQYQYEASNISKEFIRNKKRVQRRPTETRCIVSHDSLTEKEKKELNRLLSNAKNDVRRITLASSMNQKFSSRKFNKINHNTILHGVLQYLEPQLTSFRSASSNAKALQVLSQYALSFIEKYNLLTLVPKDLPSMLCLLDDLGLRFDEETAMNFQHHCMGMFSEEDNKNALEKMEKYWKAKRENVHGNRQPQSIKKEPVEEKNVRTRRSSRNKC